MNNAYCTSGNIESSQDVMTVNKWVTSCFWGWNEYCVWGKKNRQSSSDPTNKLFFFSSKLEIKSIFSKIKPFIYQVTDVGEKKSILQVGEKSLMSQGGNSPSIQSSQRASTSSDALLQPLSPPLQLLRVGNQKIKTAHFPSCPCYWGTAAVVFKAPRSPSV